MHEKKRIFPRASFLRPFGPKKFLREALNGLFVSSFFAEGNKAKLLRKLRSLISRLQTTKAQQEVQKYP